MIDHTFNTSYDHSDVINKDKIAALGFSLGGTTTLWLSGIKADKDKFRQTMDDKYARWSDWPKYALEAVNWTKAEQSYKDERITTVISIAPDLGEAFTKGGLKEADVPTLIIVEDKDCITPKKQNAEFYAKGIEGSELLVIDGAEHFTFMNKCSAIGFQITPNLCASDGKKEKAHTQVIDKIYNSL